MTLRLDSAERLQVLTGPAAACAVEHAAKAVAAAIIRKRLFIDHPLEPPG
jgi:hypothetical protein